VNDRTGAFDRRRLITGLIAGVPHPDPEDPPRRRGNKTRGHGSWQYDSPTVCGVVGREGGQVRLTVTERSDGETLERVAMRARWPMAAVNTDEWGGYDDGDGVREVHVDTLEGLWTGMSNFLRAFRGVSMKYLYLYVARFEWGYNVKRATPSFLWAILGVSSATI
jgi:transposase